MSEKITDVNALREAASALNEEARLNFRDPSWRFEKAAEMTEVIYEGFDHENVVSLLTEVENIGWNDQPTLSIKINALILIPSAHSGDCALTHSIASFPPSMTHSVRYWSHNSRPTAQYRPDIGWQQVTPMTEAWFSRASWAGVMLPTRNNPAAAAASLSAPLQTTLCRPCVAPIDPMPLRRGCRCRKTRRYRERKSDMRRRAQPSP